MESIRFRISESTVDDTGHYIGVTVHMVEDTTREGLGAQYPKYLHDIIMHALSVSTGRGIEGNDRFTYTFPFKLA